MLKTFNNESMVKLPRSRGQPALLKPQCVVNYNNNMGSVDQQDAIIRPYSAARKSMKWHKKLSFHLLHMALLNVQILYVKSGGTKTMSLDFFAGGHSYTHCCHTD